MTDGGRNVADGGGKVTGGGDDVSSCGGLCCSGVDVTNVGDGDIFSFVCCTGMLLSSSLINLSVLSTRLSISR